MSELMDIIVSWPSLLVVLMIFGVAPGTILRVLVLLYPKDDARRRELIAELYAMRRIERPLWVCEQLETAVFEGLSKRIQSRRTRRAEAKDDRAAAKRTATSQRPEDGVPVHELLAQQGHIVRDRTPGRHRSAPAGRLWMSAEQDELMHKLGRGEGHAKGTTEEKAS